MIVERDIVLAALQRMEADAHADGWDGQPALAALDGHHACRPKRLPIPDMVWQDTGPRLMLLARAGDGPGTPLRTLLDAGLANPRFAGIALRNEVWIRAGLSEQEQQAYRRGEGPRLADMPDQGPVRTVEARQVAAIDTSGRGYWVTRVRGEEPQSVSWEYDDPGHLGGRIATALRLMVIAACGRLPGDQHQIGPLAAWREHLIADPALKIPPRALGRPA